MKKLKKSLVGKLELPTKKADSHYLLFLLFILKYINNNSIFWNYNNGKDSLIDYSVLIDLKGNELSLYNYKNTKFIDNIEGVETIFKELKEIMYNRYKVMKQTGDKKFKGLPIYVVIDEVGTISN